jgi:integrase
MAKPYIVEREGKKGKSIYVRIPYKNPETGKWGQKWQKAESKSHAQRLISDYLEKREAQDGSLFETKDTLDQYLDKWLEKRAKLKVARSTYEDYCEILKHHVRPVLGRKQLAKLRREHIQDLVNDMQLKKYSASTIRYVYAALCGALRDAVRDGILSVNPAREVDLPKKTRKRPKALTPEEARKFLEACSRNKHGLLFEVALLTGMRPEEYLALQWGDVNFEKCTVTVNRTIRWGKWHKWEWYWGTGKTEKSRRTIPIPAHLTQKLSEHRKRQLERRMKLGEKYQNLELVFASEPGTPLPLDNIRSRYFKAILKDAGLPPMRVYDLRHSFATLILNAEGEMKLKTISDLLGHSNISTTAEYLHPDESMKREASDSLVSVIFQQ